MRRAVGESSNCNLNKGLWKRIWELNVSNVVKNFIWKEIKEVLPTNINLFYRKVLKDVFCPICRRVDKSVCHTVWSCPIVLDVWGDPTSLLQK